MTSPIRFGTEIGFPHQVMEHFAHEGEKKHGSPHEMVKVRESMTMRP